MSFSVALLAYDRPQKLEPTLARLRAIGVLSETSSVEAFLDGAKSNVNKEGVDACALLLEQLGSEVPLTLHRHARNRGLSGIIRDLDYVFSKHDRVVVIEDDVLLQPASLDLLRRGWGWLEDRTDVMSIGFYQAVPFPMAPQAFFCSARFTCWGWMSTAQKWSVVRSTSLRGDKAPPSNAETRDIENLIRRGKIVEGETSWDYVVAAQMLASGMRQIVPRHSLSFNSGMDSGVHGSDSIFQRLHAGKTYTDRDLGNSLFHNPKRSSRWYQTYMRLLTRG